MEVINLSVGTPDFRPDDHVIAALKEAAGIADNFKYSLADIPELIAHLDEIALVALADISGGHRKVLRGEDLAYRFLRDLPVKTGLLVGGLFLRFKFGLLLRERRFPSGKLAGGLRKLCGKRHFSGFKLALTVCELGKLRLQLFFLSGKCVEPCFDLGNAVCKLRDTLLDLRKPAFKLRYAFLQRRKLCGQLVRNRLPRGDERGDLLLKRRFGCPCVCKLRGQRAFLRFKVRKLCFEVRKLRLEVCLRLRQAFLIDAMHRLSSSGGMAKSGSFFNCSFSFSICSPSRSITPSMSSSKRAFS